MSDHEDAAEMVASPVSKTAVSIFLAAVNRAFNWRQRRREKAELKRAIEFADFIAPLFNGALEIAIHANPGGRVTPESRDLCHLVPTTYDGRGAVTGRRVRDTLTKGAKDMMARGDNERLAYPATIEIEGGETRHLKCGTKFYYTMGRLWMIVCMNINAGDLECDGASELLLDMLRTSGETVHKFTLMEKMRKEGWA